MRGSIRLTAGNKAFNSQRAPLLSQFNIIRIRALCLVYLLKLLFYAIHSIENSIVNHLSLKLKLNNKWMKYPSKKHTNTNITLPIT